MSKQFPTCSRDPQHLYTYKTTMRNTKHLPHNTTLLLISIITCHNPTSHTLQLSSGDCSCIPYPYLYLGPGRDHGGTWASQSRGNGRVPGCAHGIPLVPGCGNDGCDCACDPGCHHGSVNVTCGCYYNGDNKPITKSFDWFLNTYIVNTNLFAGSHTSTSFWLSISLLLLLTPKSQSKGATYLFKQISLTPLHRTWILSHVVYSVVR